MKRTALLLAVLAAFSITSVSQVHASPVAGEQAVTVSSWLSYYFAYFMRGQQQNDAEIFDGIVVEVGDDVIVRGDADDYANGRGGGDQDIDPIGPDNEKNKTELE